jgi:hypothetical protein
MRVNMEDIKDIIALNKIIQDCFIVRERLETAASHYRDARLRYEEAERNKDPQELHNFGQTMRRCDEESLRLPATILGEWPHLAGLYHHNFYEVKKNNGSEKIDLHES